MKKVLSLLFVVSLVLTLVACGSSSESVQKPDDSAAKNSNDGPTIYVVLKTLSSQYWKFVEAGANTAGKDLGVNVVVLGPPSEAHIVEQVNMLEDVLGQNPAAIVTAPTQPTTVIDVFNRAKSQNVPVLLIDTDADWADKHTFLGTDNFSAGKEGGKLLASMLKPGDKVALLEGARGNTAMDDRIRGAKEVLEEAGMVVVAQQPADSDKFKAAGVIEAVLQTNPDLAGIFSSNDDMAVGALSATKVSGLKIPIIGTDGTIEAVELIISGELAGTIAQSPYDMGYEGVAYALKVINGEQIDQRIPANVNIITSDNAQEFLEFLKSIN